MIYTIRLAGHRAFIVKGASSHEEARKAVEELQESRMA
jgi:hypothetical protein